MRFYLGLCGGIVVLALVFGALVPQLINMHQDWAFGAALLIIIGAIAGGGALALCIVRNKGTRT